jgi:hypothetical protein
MRMSVPAGHGTGAEGFGPFGQGDGQELPEPGYVLLPQAPGAYADGSLTAAGFPAAGPGAGWPAGELEQVLGAAAGDPGAASAQVLEVLGRSTLWVPVPGGDVDAGLPGIDVDGTAHVPVFSSEAQLRQAAPGLMFGVLPAVEFARGLPPQVGLAVNPGGTAGVLLPPAAVEELVRSAAHGAARGRRWEPEPDEEPVDFLATAAGEFAVTPVVLSARRALGSVEGGAPVLYVGVELDAWQEEDRARAMDAVGRALGAAPLPWAVNLLLLDVAQDPLAEWMQGAVEPFFTRE